MFAIDDPTAVAVMPTPEAAGTAGFWTEGNPGLGQAATLMRASFFNGLQQELLNILAAASITPNKTTYNQLLAAIRIVATGRLLAVQVFSTAGTFTYTETAGTKNRRIRVQGGGGGGGGAASTSSGAFGSIGQGGGAGAYGESLIFGGSSLSGTTVTVAAGGTVSAGAVGNSGGTSSFGALLSAPGGPGGNAGGNSAVGSNLYIVGGVNSSISTGGNIINMEGGSADAAFAIAQDTFVSGRGGRSFFGPGARAMTTGDIGGARGVAGLACNNYGGGGSGAGAISASPGTFAGGAGGKGIVIIEEFT